MVKEVNLLKCGENEINVTKTVPEIYKKMCWPLNQNQQQVTLARKSLLRI